MGMRLTELIETARRDHAMYPATKRGDLYGFFQIRGLNIVASNGDVSIGCPWEHVSVSTPVRTPTWAEMCFVKRQFWDDEDTVVQFHPPRSAYVNNHDYCLHLWRPIGIEIPTPPTWTVGTLEKR
jgi:hypothetical protein